MKALIRSEVRVIALFLIIAVVGFIASTPRMAGADEPVHQATAWNLANEPFAADSTYVLIPKTLITKPCFAFKRYQDASCIDVDSSLGEKRHRVTTYPFPYFYSVLIGQKLASEINPTYASYGGRISALLIQIVILLFSYRFFKRRGVPLLQILMGCTTSTWLFFATVVNPSSLEILLLFLIGLTIGSFLNGLLPAPGFRGRNSQIAFLGFALLLLLAAASRPITIVWIAMVLTLAFALRDGSSLTLRDWFGLVAATIPGALFTIYWRFFESIDLQASTGTPFTRRDYLDAFFSSIAMIHIRLFQMVGNLGWLDTPMPIWLFLLVGVVWVSVYFRAMPRRILFISSLLGLTAIVLLPAMIEMYGTPQIGDRWWQGRYTLPVLVGMLALILVRYGGHGLRIFRFLLVTNGLAIAFMLLQNTFRYNFGIRGFLPIRLDNPALGEIRYLVALLSVAFLVLLSVQLLRISSGEKNHI